MERRASSADSFEMAMAAAHPSRREVLRWLASSEEIVDALTAGSPVGAFVSDAAGECLYVNERWCELAGMREADALGDGWSRALHPEDRGRVLTEWEEASKANRESIVEYRFLRSGGTVVWVQGFAAPLRADDGTVIGWAGSCVDVSVRHRRERQQELLVGLGLRAQRSRPDAQLLADALATAADGLGAEFASYLELAADGALVVRLGHGWQVKRGTQFSAEADSPAGRALATGKPVLVDVAAGDQGWLRTTHGVRSSVAVPILAGERTLGVLAAHSRRIGAFEAADLQFARALSNTLSAALMREQSDSEARRLASIVSSSSDAIISRDLDGTVRTWNDAAERMFGYTPAEMIGRSTRILPSPDSPWQIERVNDHILRGESITEQETTCMHFDGSPLMVSVTMSPLLDSEGGVVGVSIIAHDISARRALEEQLLQSQKLEALGGLAGGIAHDFNNLLTVILGHAELILADPDPPAARSRHEMGAVRDDAQHAATLTRQLLAYSRKQLLTLEVLDLNEVVGKVRSMLDRLIEENILIEVLSEPDLRAIEADRGQLGQVLTNLVINARDATPDGGHVAISTDNVTVDTAQAELLVHAPPGDYVRLTVKDDGTGMDAQTAARAFDPFFTTKPPTTGTGLGLSTVYGIVKQSHGFVYLDSTPGRGTTVSIYFPALPAHVKAERRRLPQPPVQPAAAKRILIVEDNDAVRTVLTEQLQQAGHNVVGESGGEAALRHLEQHEPIDLAISDVMMPGISGPEFARRALALEPSLRVILVTGFSPETIEISDTRISVLAKPFGNNQLLQQIANRRC